jgi:hypothetical protein
MADAGVLKDSGRLPWLEPYRAPEQKRKHNRGGPIAVAVIALVALFSLFLWRDAPRFQADDPTPQTTVAMPTPADMQSQAVLPPIAPPAETVAAAGESERVAKPLRVRPRRSATAGADSDTYGAIVSEQIAALLLAAEPPADEPAPIAIEPVSVQPLRPTVNPRAKVAKGKTAQLGVYFTARDAEVAWRSAVRDYTYLVTMPKNIQRLRLRGKYYYRLQLGTPSTSHATQLCGHLRSIGRACRVA